MAIWDRACLDLHHSQDNANIYLRMLLWLQYTEIPSQAGRDLIEHSHKA